MGWGPRKNPAQTVSPAHLQNTLAVSPLHSAHILRARTIQTQTTEITDGDPTKRDVRTSYHGQSSQRVPHLHRLLTSLPCLNVTCLVPDTAAAVRRL
jgi:hypothetical protein